jgi:hypothetical protein
MCAPGSRGERGGRAAGPAGGKVTAVTQPSQSSAVARCGTLLRERGQLWPVEDVARWTSEEKRGSARARGHRIEARARGVTLPVRRAENLGHSVTLPIGRAEAPGRGVARGRPAYCASSAACGGAGSCAFHPPLKSAQRPTACAKPSSTGSAHACQELGVSTCSPAVARSASSPSPGGPRMSPSWNAMGPQRVSYASAFPSGAPSAPK